MDSFDPVRNEESAHSKRRTSILKVPWKSTEAVQQDQVVECAKPLEKRISRRVSFAPANDVLLFPKDVKNTSPAQAPLQELMPGGAIVNSVQFNVIEDQQFTGMDPFSNVTKQMNKNHPKDKANVSGFNFGERTILFNDDDISMTQCQTIKVTDGEELLNTSRGFFHGPGEKTLIIDRSMDMTLSQTVNMTYDHDVSISEPSPPSVFPFTSTVMAHGTEFISYANTDKENLVPKLFKSTPQESRSKADARKSQIVSSDYNFTDEPSENASRQIVNFDRKGECGSEKTIVFPDGGFMDITQNWTSNIVVAPSVSSSQDQRLRERKSFTGLSERARHQDIRLTSGSGFKGLKTPSKTSVLQTLIDPEEESRDKTVRFLTDDACMDVTSCHTVKISSELQRPDLSSVPMYGETTMRFTTDEAGMDFTQCLTGNIAGDMTPRSRISQKQESTVESLTAPSVDLDFENFFASLSGENTKVKISPAKPNTSSIKGQSNSQTMLLLEKSTIKRALSEGAETCSDKSNANMDFTEAQKCCSEGQVVTNFQLRRSAIRANPIKGIDTSYKPGMQRHLVNFHQEDFQERTVQIPVSVTSCNKVHMSPELKPDLPLSEKTVRFDAAMDTTQSHTVNITHHLGDPLHENFGLQSNKGAKTVEFNDTIMDVTQSHTVQLHTDLKPDLPFSEKTVRFEAAAMDVTQCHTVNITKDMEPPLQDVCTLPKSGQRSARFGMDCITKQETKSSMDLKDRQEKCTNDSQLQQQRNMLPVSGEKKQYYIDDDGMDVTKSHTMMIDTEPQIISALGILSKNEEKTVRCSPDDDGMEVTQCLTSNVVFETEVNQTEFSPTSNSITMGCPTQKKREPTNYTNRRCKSLAGFGLKSALKARRSVSLSSLTVNSGFPTENGNINTTLSKVNINHGMSSFETPKTAFVNDNTAFLSVIEEKSIADMSQKEDNHGINVTEVQTHNQNVFEDHGHTSVVAESIHSADEGNSGITNRPEVEINALPNLPQENNKNDDGEVEEKTEGSPLSVLRDCDIVPSQSSRERSLADIQTKMRRISQILSAPPHDVAADVEPNVEVHNKQAVPKDAPEANTDTEKGENQPDIFQEEPVTPFRLEAKQLMSQLSAVGCKPKLPRRSTREDTKTPDRSLQGKSTEAQNVHAQNKVDNFDLNVSDIQDEMLVSYEDLSEPMDNDSVEKKSVDSNSFHEFDLDQELKNEVLEEESAHVNDRKRLLPEEENIMGKEKRTKTCSDTVMLESQVCYMDGDNISATNTQTVDSSSSSHTASLRCDATFESTSKHSLFESQLEDYACDIQRKFNDGTLTMAEFFKLFYINFVIQNPRQSVVPGRSLPDTETPLLDLSYDRHINLPKQLVYEADVQNLTEQVERFKVRMRDLDKPLTVLNRAVWEEMQHFSEAEFKSFGAKLKERHSLYRKMSKAQSHEMKGLLYSALIQTNVEEQQKLRGSMEKADVMLKNLDDCIAELEADFAAIEDEVRSHQKELDEVTNALAVNENATSELEILRTQNMNKVQKVKAETQSLQRHLNMLNMLNEWKLIEIRDNTFIYTFLHETLHLVLVFEDSEGEEADKKITDISFKHQLDERSECHAHLVHALVSQFAQENLTRKYPKRKHVPQLLHDISLVVSRCRQLGEELRRLKTWGSQRFDILDLHCHQQEVKIIFSSLRRFAKFEIVFGVHLTNTPYTLELRSFKNIIGSTTIQQVEEIVSSFTPEQLYLTKMIKKIHKSLLSE